MCTEMFKALEIIAELLNSWFDQKVIQNDHDYYYFLQDCLRNDFTNITEDFCRENAFVLHLLKNLLALNEQMEKIKELAGKPVSIDDNIIEFEIVQ